MIKDYRTIRQVEKTLCLRNGKPFRSAEQKASARRTAKIVEKGPGRGSYYAPLAPQQFHDRCACTKRGNEQCQMNNLDRNNRV